MARAVALIFLFFVGSCFSSLVWARQNLVCSFLFNYKLFKPSSSNDHLIDLYNSFPEWRMSDVDFSKTFKEKGCYACHHSIQNSNLLDYREERLERDSETAFLDSYSAFYHVPSHQRARFLRPYFDLSLSNEEQAQMAQEIKKIIINVFYRIENQAKDF